MLNPNDARLLLKWLIDSGADEVLADAPIDRTSVAPPAPAPVAPARVQREAPPPRPPSSFAPPPPSMAAESARAVAQRCQSLEELAEAVRNFDGCTLKTTATHTVFSDGPGDAPVMLIGEAPGRDEDLQGIPFVGRSGQLLDRMLQSIGLDRTTNAYITNILFWRPPGNRTPTPEEAAICAPFLIRHIELKQPRVLVLLGATPAKHILQREEGITRIRGRWGSYMVNGSDVPALPTYHPAFLLRTPGAKRQSWQDLLSLKLKLRELGVI